MTDIPAKRVHFTGSGSGMDIARIEQADMDLLYEIAVSGGHLRMPGRMSAPVSTSSKSALSRRSFPRAIFSSGS